MKGSCFDATMGSFDGAEICELVGLYIQSKLEKILPKSNFGLYQDNWLGLLRNLNRQQTGKVRKNIIRVFKDIGFSLEIETNLKEVDFLDVSLNLQNGTYILTKRQKPGRQAGRQAGRDRDRDRQTDTYLVIIG